MKLPLISLLVSAGFLTLVSCTGSLASNVPQTPQQPPIPEIEKSFTGDIPLSSDDSHAATLLQSIQDRFEEPPFDGSFGMSRAVRINHNINMLNPDVHKDGHAALDELEKENSVYILSFSTPFLKNNRGRRVIAPVATYKETSKPKDEPVGFTRSMNGKYYTVDYRKSNIKAEEWKQNESDLTGFAKELFSSKDNYRLFTMGGEVKQIVELQKIYSTEKSCLSCHKDIAGGEPIGIIGIQRIPLLNERKN